MLDAYLFGRDYLLSAPEAPIHPALLGQVQWDFFVKESSSPIVVLR